MKINLKTLLLWVGVFLIMSVPCALAHTDVTPEEAHELIGSTDDLTVVDVREPSEYCGNRGHIPGALNYPLSSGTLYDRYEELPVDGPILVVCQSGSRSNQAATFLDSQGFSMVYDMMGGMNSWMWETELCSETENKYGGGTGEPNDPYLIYTAEQMNAIGAEPNDWDKHFKLMEDIDLSRYTGTDFNIIGYWVQWYFPDNIPFTGLFDGNGHRISNFSYKATTVSDSIGLFAYVDGDNTQIKDLGLIDPNIDARRDVGSLVGHMGTGAITGCYVEGGRVGGNSNVGGLVGFQDYGTITNCYTTISVSGDTSVGGLVGSNNWWCRISDCYSTASISGMEYVGGLVGLNRSTIVNCYVQCGSVLGSNIVGGFVGSNGWPQPPMARPYPPGEITNCYSTARVSGNNHVGGLVGRQGYSRVMASFWDKETSGQTISDGGTVKTTSEMQTASTFLEAGWDFVGETDNGTDDIWSICDGTNYPRFVRQIPAVDFVCPDGVTIEDFAFFMGHWLDDNCDASNEYCEGTDLDRSGTVDVNDLEIFFENWPDKN